MTTNDAGVQGGRVFVILVLIAGLLGALMVLATFTGDRRLAPPVRGEGSPAAPDPDTFEGDTTLTVTIGRVELLYPGLNRTVPVRVKNPFAFGIRITRFDVSSLGTAICPASHLSIGAHRADGPVIGAYGFADTRTTIGLTGSAPNACQRETFKFSVTVTAVMS